VRRCPLHKQIIREKIILSELTNFPTDLYIAEALCKERGFSFEIGRDRSATNRIATRRCCTDVDPCELPHRRHVEHESHDGFSAQRGRLNRCGDLAHSAGAVPVDLNGSQADFAVGCGYKYLNGGPGAPAFVWVHPKHTDRFWQPLSGWWGHAAPFEFTPDYKPAAGISRYQCGTQPVLSLTALDTALDVFLEVEKLGGMQALRKKNHWRLQACL
jgi:kynureninase